MSFIPDVCVYVRKNAGGSFLRSEGGLKSKNMTACLARRRQKNRQGKRGYEVT
jgi:hypothetical protein